MLITNIQRFSLHDGPGIRTTIFIKGCSLRCPWCSNPENLNVFPEKYVKNGVESIYGSVYTEDKIYDEITKDRFFYGTDGGVTFSGGEALLQGEKLVSLIKKLKKLRITVAVETCLFVPEKQLKKIIPYIDFFYVDMKILNRDRCNKVINGNIDLYRNNMKLLTSQKSITVRIPVIGGYTDDEENINDIISELKKYENSIIKVELIKGHNLGSEKYESLGKAKPVFKEVNDSFMEQYKKKIEAHIKKVPVEICKI